MPIDLNLDNDNYDSALDSVVRLAGGNAAQEETVVLTLAQRSATFYLRQSDLYLTAFQKTEGGQSRVEVPNLNLNYQQHQKPTSINMNEIQSCITRANNGKLLTDNNGRYFVLAAFVIAEAARFMTARVALYAAKHNQLPSTELVRPGQCTVQTATTYSNHEPVITNWDNIRTRAGVTNKVLTYTQIQQYFSANPPTAYNKECLRAIGIPI